tara:strand:- start:177380 stop:178579 length:1200 start_codon:yes stop_codon:yes gene_type:complete
VAAPSSFFCLSYDVQLKGALDMSGKVADPIFINGADDEVLVGDTVEIVAAEEAASNAGASLSTFENAIPETTPPEKQEALKSPAGQSASSSASEVNSSSAGAETLAAVNNIDMKDEDAANATVKELKEKGQLDSLEGNGQAINKLVTATGLEKRLKEITPDYDEKTYNNKLKLKLLKEYDWSTTACDKSMRALFSGLSALFPNITFGDNSDGKGTRAAKDTSLLAALRCGAKWLTDPAYDGMLEEMGRGLRDQSDSFMETTLSDFQSDKQVRFVRKAVKKMNEDEGAPATERLARYNPQLIPDILNKYPWGFTDSYDTTWENAYNELTSSLNDIDPNWYTMQRGGKTISNLEYYYKATDEALHILSYDMTHARNIAMAGRYPKKGYSHRMVNGVLLPEG